MKLPACTGRHVGAREVQGLSCPTVELHISQHLLGSHRWVQASRDKVIKMPGPAGMVGLVRGKDGMGW